jgi:hypothetical protein
MKGRRAPPKNGMRARTRTVEFTVQRESVRYGLNVEAGSVGFSVTLS